MDKMMASLQHFASEMERERARQRTYSAMASKARAGHVTGGRVHGYDNIDVFVPDPAAEGRRKRLFVSRRINEEQATNVRRMFTLCADGVGLTRIAKALNEDGIAPPRPGRSGWAPTAVREILHLELYRGVIVWNRSQKIMRGGTRRQRRRPPSEWLRLPAEELRIVSDTLWEAAHRRLAGTRSTFRPTPGRPPGRLDLTSPYLLSGLGRCTLCGGSLIAMSRHHGRRRGFFYGCAYNSKRGPRICTNNLHMPQAMLEKAVIDAVARKFDATAVGATIDRALELFEEERQTANERRKATEEALRAVRIEEARLVAAVKHGERLDALLTALQKAQERRQTLEGQLANNGGRAASKLADSERIRAKLLSRAADIRGVLTRRDESETRGVLKAVFAERIQFAPFNDGEMRGYQFAGMGSYGDILFGDTCPTSDGGPKGI
jgi:site-specific DNA recombinase